MRLPPAAFGLSHRGLARGNAQEVAIAIIMHSTSVAYRAHALEQVAHADLINGRGRRREAMGLPS